MGSAYELSLFLFHSFIFPTAFGAFCCNCSNRPTARFRFCFSPGLFFYLGSKQASNWTEAGHELCPASCRPLPSPVAHHPLRQTALHLLIPPIRIQRSSPVQGRLGGIVPCRDSFGYSSIFCCFSGDWETVAGRWKSSGAALLSLRFR